jgi:hypothetical protein
MLSPQAKTAAAAAIPVALAALYFLVPSVTPEQVTHVVAGLVVIAGAIQGVVNVFHVSAKVKGVLAGVVAWADAVQSDVAVPTSTIAEARRLADGAVKKEGAS